MMDELLEQARQSLYSPGEVVCSRAFYERLKACIDGPDDGFGFATSLPAFPVRVDEDMGGDQAQLVNRGGEVYRHIVVEGDTAYIYDPSELIGQIIGSHDE